MNAMGEIQAEPRAVPLKFEIGARTLMAVDVRLTPTFEAGAARPLFRASIPADIITYRNHYAVMADGQRFVVDSAGTREPITVVVNWNALLNP